MTHLRRARQSAQSQRGEAQIGRVTPCAPFFSDSNGVQRTARPIKYAKLALVRVSGPGSIFRNKARLYIEQSAALFPGGTLSREGREVLLAIYWEVSAS